jgi:hypothetical protein
MDGQCMYRLCMNGQCVDEQCLSTPSKEDDDMVIR